jgi:hypothetical protein
VGDRDYIKRQDKQNTSIKYDKINHEPTISSEMKKNKQIQTISFKKQKKFFSKCKQI